MQSVINHPVRHTRIFLPVQAFIYIFDFHVSTHILENYQH